MLALLASQSKPAENKDLTIITNRMLFASSSTKKMIFKGVTLPYLCMSRWAHVGKSATRLC